MFLIPLVNSTQILNGQSILLKKWGVIEPVQINLGVSYDSKRNKVSGVYEQVPVNDTFIYLPLFKTLVHCLKGRSLQSVE